MIFVACDGSLTESAGTIICSGNWIQIAEASVIGGGILPPLTIEQGSLLGGAILMVFAIAYNWKNARRSG